MDLSLEHLGSGEEITALPTLRRHSFTQYPNLTDSKTYTIDRGIHRGVAYPQNGKQHLAVYVPGNDHGAVLQYFPSCSSIDIETIPVLDR